MERYLSKKKPVYDEGVMDEVHRYREVIKSLGKSITMLEMELSASRRSLESGSSLDGPPESAVPFSDGKPRKRMLMVVGMNIAFSSRKKHDPVRETWMPQGKIIAEIGEGKGHCRAIYDWSHFNMQEGLEGNQVAGTMKKRFRGLDFLSVPSLINFPKGFGLSSINGGREDCN